MNSHLFLLLLVLVVSLLLSPSLLRYETKLILPVAGSGGSGTCSTNSDITIFTTIDECNPMQFVVAPDPTIGSRRFALCFDQVIGRPFLLLVNATQTIRVNASGSDGLCAHPLSMTWAQPITSLLIQCSSTAIQRIPFSNMSPYDIIGPVVNYDVHIKDPFIGECYMNIDYSGLEYLPPDVNSALGYLLVASNCYELASLQVLSLSSGNFTQLMECDDYLITSVTYVSELSRVYLQCGGSGSLFNISVSRTNLSQPLHIQPINQGQDYTIWVHDNRFADQSIFYTGSFLGGLQMFNATSYTFSLLTTPTACVAPKLITLDPTTQDGIIVSCTSNQIISVRVSGSGKPVSLFPRGQCIPRNFFMPDASAMEMSCTNDMIEAVSGTSWTELGGSQCSAYFVFDPVHQETFALCFLGLYLLRNGMAIALPLSDCRWDRMYLALDPNLHLAYVVCSDSAGVSAIDLNSPDFTETQILKTGTAVYDNILNCSSVTQLYLESHPYDGLSTAKLIISCQMYDAEPEALPGNLTTILLNGTTPIQTAPQLLLPHLTCLSPTSVFRHTKNDILYVACNDRILGLKRDGTVIYINTGNICFIDILTPSVALIEDLTNPSRLLMICENGLISAIEGDLTQGGPAVQIRPLVTLTQSLVLVQDPSTGQFLHSSSNSLGLQKFHLDATGQLVLDPLELNPYCSGGIFGLIFRTDGSMAVSCSHGGLVARSLEFACMNGFYWTNGGCQICEAGSARAVIAGGGGFNFNLSSVTTTSPWSCAICQPGTIAPAKGQSACSNCQPGSYTKDYGATVCSPCLPGEEQPAAGQSLCTPCQPGFYSSTTSTKTCSPCPFGTASSAYGTAICLPCYPGTFANATGLTSCYPSSPGSEVIGVGSNSSTLCAPGSFSSHESTIICSLCPTGRYQPESGATECLDCELGKFASGVGSVACEFCAPGSYASKNQTIYCTPCIPGSASNLIGLNDSCPPCPPGQAQSIEGQISCIDCTPPHYSPNPGSPTCTRCAYAVSLDHTSCGLNPCPNNYEYIDTDGCQLCGLGEYSNNATIGGCVHCLTTYYTPQRGSDCISCQLPGMDGLICIDGLASVKPDYFAYLTDPDPITGIQLYATEPCPVGFCPGGSLQFSTDMVLSNSTSGGSGSSSNTTSAIIYCEFPRLNSPDNLLCGACVDGYLPWAAKCVSCTEVNSGLFFGGFVLSLALVIFLLRSGGSAAGPLAILLYFIQTAALEIGSVSQWLNWLHIFNFGTESTSACLAPWSPIEQMIFSIFIPIILCGEIIALALGHRLLKYHYSHTDSSSSNSSWLRNLSLDFSLDRYIAGVMSVLLFTYTQVTVACFKYLYCIDVGSHHRIVFTAPTIDCQSSAYRSGLGLVGFTIAIYVIGFPVTMFIFLYRFRHHHSPHPSAPAPSSTHSTTSSSATTNSILPPSSLSSSLSDYSLDIQAVDNLTHSRDAGRSLNANTQLRPFIIRYGPLYLMFQSHAWFYQPFILLRRASFVLISVLLVQDHGARFFAFGLGNFISLLFHLWLHPFIDLQNNYLETVSYTLLIIVSMVLTYSLPPYQLPTQIFVLFAILPVGAIMTFLVIQRQLLQLHQAIQRSKTTRSLSPIGGGTVARIDPESTIEPALYPNPVLFSSASASSFHRTNGKNHIELSSYPPPAPPLQQQVNDPFVMTDSSQIELKLDADSGMRIDSEAAEL